MLFKPRYLVVLCVIVLIARLSAALCKDWSVDDIPHPHNDFAKCNSAIGSFVCDPANILTLVEKNFIDEEISKVEDLQVRVLIINKMRNPMNPIEKASKVFAKSIHDKWVLGVGRGNGLNNGILIFLSIHDRQIYISTTQKVVKIISNSQADKIIQYIKPHLQTDQFGFALKVAVRKINETKQNQSIVRLLCFFLSFYVFGFLVMRYLMTKRLLPSKRLQEAVNDLTAFAEAKDSYAPKCCPVCLSYYTESKIAKKYIADDFSKSKSESTGKIHCLSAILKTGIRNWMEWIIRKLNGKAKESPYHPMTLPCEHVICYSCLAKLLKNSTNANCPICQKNIDQSGKEENDPTEGSMCSTLSLQSGTPTSMRLDEFSYRLNQIHILYPKVFNVDNMNQATSALTNQDILLTLKSLQDSIDLEKLRHQGGRTRGNDYDCDYDCDFDCDFDCGAGDSF